MKKNIYLLQKWFEQEPSIELAFLFGSVAKNKETKESDVDIAVYLKDIKKADAIWHKSGQILERNTDLIILNDAPASLISNIIKTGTPLTIKNRSLFWKLYLEKSMEAEDFAEFAENYYKVSKRAMSLSPEDRTRLLERFDFLNNEMLERQKMATITFEDYESDKTKRRNLERWTENIINAMIDIAKIILASEKKEMPKTYESSLEKFGLFAGLTKTEAEKLSSFARLRNLLAHEYLETLYEKISEFVNGFLSLYENIHQFIEKYLQLDKNNFS